MYPDNEETSPIITIVSTLSKMSMKNNEQHQALNGGNEIGRGISLMEGAANGLQGIINQSTAGTLKVLDPVCHDPTLEWYSTSSEEVQSKGLLGISYQNHCTPLCIARVLTGTQPSLTREALTGYILDTYLGTFRR